MIKVGFGLIGLEKLFGNDLAALAQAVKRAEDMGVDVVTCTDHVIMSENIDKYPYGPFPMPMDWAWLEPLVLMSAVATATKKILLGTGIIIAPLRPAALLAKQLATLDVLSQGRLRPGLGVGWQKEEYDACGVPWEGRFGYLMEQVAVCRALWGGAPASFHGKRVNFDKLYSYPFPVQGAKMPIYFGLAPTDLNFERIAEAGDGWIPMEQNVERLTESIARLRAAFEKRGRKTSELNVRCVPTMRMVDGRPNLDATLERSAKYVEAGATEIEIHPLAYCQSPADLDKVLEKLVAVKKAL